MRLAALSRAVSLKSLTRRSWTDGRTLRPTSRMHSSTRPRRRQPPPPPIYLQDQHALYCKSCGRVMSAQRGRQDGNVVKYCSSSCRGRKPNHVDQQIEDLIAALLSSEPGSGIENTSAASRKKKGDHRTMISCDEIESLFYAELRLASAPPDGVLSAQQHGQSQADQRERVRRAARRAVLFGISTGPSLASDRAQGQTNNGEKRHPPDERPAAPGSEPRMCEAVLDGVVVEPSFAKGNWCVRWRE